MVRILLYGNCQVQALIGILSFKQKKRLEGKQNFYYLYIPCFNTHLNKEEFKNIIKDYDIIITQPIKDDYRNKDYLGTNFLLNNANYQKVIIFNSCYFDFYYPDSNYLYDKNNNMIYLHKKVDYHHKNMINYYKNKESIEKYIKEVVNNENFLSKDYLEKKGIDSLNLLENKYNMMIQKYNKFRNVYFINIVDFIKNNYKDKLLFYTNNHPTKYLEQYIGKEIVNILNLKFNINYNVDPHYPIKLILYKSIQSVVNFNINDYKPLICGNTNLNLITKIYFNYYDNCNFNDL